VERDQVVEDIEPIRLTIVTRYVIERRWCPHCGTYKESPVTAALPRHRLGLHLMLFVVYQKVAMGLSYRKIQHELQTYFGLHVSSGQLANMMEEVAHLFGPAYARLIRLLREQAALHVDKTGWRVNGTNHWLWVFVNDVVALYVISHSWGSKVPQALLGQDFAGVIISDLYSAYSPLDMKKAKCWTYLLRDSHDLTKGQPPPDSERLRFHRKLHDLFIETGLALEEAAADEVQREQIYQEMRSRLHDFAAAPSKEADCQRLADRIIKYLDDLVLWLRDPAVPPDNNMAERSLRPAVVIRKTSFGSRSRQGTLAFARLLSLIQTWERQDKDFFTTAYSALE
jgi:transposase